VKRVKTVLIVVVVALVLGTLWILRMLYARIPENPQAALTSFYERQVAEDQIMDPLILSGSEVVPLLQQEIKNPQMPNRRYAIGALGNLGEMQSVKILEEIAKSTSEVDYIRCDALTSIAMIDATEAIRVAESIVANSPACISDALRALKADPAKWLSSNAPRRTHFQALLGRHD
jgi:hypothetical protein